MVWNCLIRMKPTEHVCPKFCSVLLWNGKKSLDNRCSLKQTNLLLNWFNYNFFFLKSSTYDRLSFLLLCQKSDIYCTHRHEIPFRQNTGTGKQNGVICEYLLITIIIKSVNHMVISHVDNTEQYFIVKYYVA